MFVTLCQLWNTLKLTEYNTNLRIWLSCCLSMQSKYSCYYCHDVIECENCCRVMQSMNTCGGVSGQQTVPSPYLHCTLYFSHSPSPIRNKKNCWSKIAKIQATNDGRGDRNAARRTWGAESVFVLALTPLWFETTWAATWNVARKKYFYKYLRRLLYSVTWCHIIWSGLVSQVSFHLQGILKTKSVVTY
jgi:hypothetical protein